MFTSTPLYIQCLFCCIILFYPFRYVTFDDVLAVQLQSTSSLRRVTEFAVKDIIGQAAITHTTDVAQPAHTSLPHVGDEVI